MTVVFRIRTSAGQELSFASREMFEDFVRAGDLAPDDLVYDGETGSWSPARTHPMVLDIQYELDADAEGKKDAEAKPDARAKTGAEEDSPAEGDPAADEASGSGGDGSGAESTADNAFGLSLAPTDELTPEDEQRVFLEQLEAEREGDLDVGPSLRDSLSGFTSDTLAPRDEAPPRAPDPPPPRPEPSRRTPDRGRAPVTTETKSAPAPSGGTGRAARLLVLAGLVIGGGYAGYQFWSAESQPDVQEPVPQTAGPEAVGSGAAGPEAEPVETETEPDPVVPEPGPEPTPEAVIPDTPGAVLERAQERYLASTQAEFRGLQSIPHVWPEGPYLTVPSDYPEVVDVWQDYRSTIRAVRQADTDRYRSAYEAALDDAAVTGEARQERMDTAMAGFAASEEFRRAHFDRVEALATAAIQSHNALVEAEGLLLYDATGSTGRNAESQLLLDQVLELLEGALDADGEGPSSGGNVREWVWDGFLDAVTR